jgi:hypothetical protein
MPSCCVKDDGGRTPTNLLPSLPAFPAQRYPLADDHIYYSGQGAVYYPDNVCGRMQPPAGSALEPPAATGRRTADQPITQPSSPMRYPLADDHIYYSGQEAVYYPDNVYSRMQPPAGSALEPSAAVEHWNLM